MYSFFTFLIGLATLALVVGLVKPTIVRLKNRWMVFLCWFVLCLVFGGLAESCESDEHRETRLQEEAAEKVRRDSLAAVRSAEKSHRDSIAAVQKAKTKEEKARREAAATREEALKDSIEFAQLSAYEKAERWAAAVLPKEDRWAAYQMTEKFVKQVMLTPDSVDFPSFNGYSDEDADMVRASDDVWEFGGERFRQYSVHTTFKAQNRYGATIRYEMNAWVYNNAADNDNWRRFKMNIIDPSLKFGHPNRYVFDSDPPDSQRPRRAEMPVGWWPTSQGD